MPSQAAVKILKLLLFSAVCLVLCFLVLVVVMYSDSQWNLRKVITNSGDPAAVKILFVGDSLLYVNSMPAVLAQLIEQGAHQPTKVWQIVGPSFTWETHWQRGLAQKAIAQTPPWTDVVLQGEPLWNPPHFKTYGDRFNEIIKANKSQGVLFEEWSDRASVPDQIEINAANQTLAKTSKMPLIEIGKLWSYASTRSHIPLYGSDHVHPSQAGTYLSACALYEFFLHRDPRGLPSHFNAPQSLHPLLDLPAREALEIQTIVHDFYHDHVTESLEITH